MYNNINLKNGTYNKAMKYRMKQKKQLNETKKTDNWKNRTERHRIIMGWDKASRVGWRLLGVKVRYGVG